MPLHPASARAMTADPFFTEVRQAATPHDPVCCLVIDAEEDFDWQRPIFGTEHDTGCMLRIGDLARIAEPYGLLPTYLLTYPVLQDDRATSLLREHHAAGRCGLGVQLHPWVTPPFEASQDEHSYLGALSPATEESKLLCMIERFVACFGQPPTMFRAGRYGLSSTTTRLLERHGFLIDTSVAPRTDFSAEGGPDYADYDCDPFWFGGAQSLLEVPLCRGVVGWGGAWGRARYASWGAGVGKRLHLRSVLSRLRCAERITLSPEGNDLTAMLRLVRHRLAAGQRLFTVSLHSSSLAPGRNPYVRTEADLGAMHARLQSIFAALAAMNFHFVTLADMPSLVRGQK